MKKTMLIAASIAACFAVRGAVTVDANLPAGNVVVEGISGDTVRLRQDLRDTAGEWFYWAFRVTGAAGRTLTFDFTNKKGGGGPVGVRGCDPQKSPDTPASPEGNTEGPGTASSEPLLPS